MASPNAAFRRLIEVLNGLKIPYFVCGSVASTAHGVVRATMGVDLVAAIERRHIAELVAQLGNEFHADPDMIGQALATRRSFNLIHYDTAFKFDVFPLGSSPFEEEQFRRSAPAAVSLAGEGHVDVPVQSVEDTLLSKLSWFRAGGEVSERQWNDVRGIVAIQRDRLDREYLHRWATYLHVEDLLERALLP